MSISTWMGYPATWRVRCVSISEASEIITAYKRLDRENWRQARWELQNRFSALRLNSMLSAVARPFQPQTVTPPASGSTLVAGPPPTCSPVGRPELEGPIVRASPSPSPGRRLVDRQYTTDNEGASMDMVTSTRSSHRRQSSRGNRSHHSGSDSDDTHASGGRHRKKNGF